MLFRSVMGLSFFSSSARAAAKRAPDITGQWEGVLKATGFPDTRYTLNISTQNKKNGKFTGQATFTGFKPVSLTGKIQPNRKMKGKFSGDINGEPIVFTVRVTLARDGQSAEGTFNGKGADGKVVVSGTTTLERVPDCM